ncbi:MAG: hypothetical protein DRP71_04895 [Verrucomicrobia bacterium]|nr:MAG: hypothetical protein DRP71_04895 [Verrucomicrobiota bacterium]
MRKSILPLLLAISVPAVLPAGRLFAQEDRHTISGETLAERNLKLLVIQERAIWVSIKEATNEVDIETAKPKFQEVLTGYDGLIRDNPEFVPAFVAYGLLLGRIDERTASRAILMRANQLEPNIAVVKNQLGNFLVEDARYKEALPYYLIAIELEPKEPLYHYQLGTLLTEFMEYFIKDRLFTRDTIEEQMQEAFLRASRLDPDNWAFSYRYAESFYDLENPDWEKAMIEWARLEQVARRGIERQTVQLHQANIMIKQGRFLAARDILEEVNEPVLESNRRALEVELDGRLNLP